MKLNELRWQKSDVNSGGRNLDRSRTDLNAQNMTLKEYMLRLEHGQQATLNVSIRILPLRVLYLLVWEFMITMYEYNFV